MPAKIHDLMIEQGTTFEYGVRWLRDDDPVDITGYTAALQCRTTPTSSVKLLDLTTANNKLIIDTGTDGIVTIRLTATQTSAIAPPATCSQRTYLSRRVIELGAYDLELTSPDTVVVRLLEGRIFLVPEVTR